jgi:hypothetical protein
VKRGKGKKEREKERERGSDALFCTEAASDRLARLFHKSRLNVWRD